MRRITWGCGLLTLIGPLASAAPTPPTTCAVGSGTLSGSGNAMEDADIWLDAGENNASSAPSVVVADFDGDGQDDLVVGADNVDGRYEVRLFLGPLPVAPGRDVTLALDRATASTVLLSETGGAQWAWRLARAGDVDGDAVEDLLLVRTPTAAMPADVGVVLLVTATDLAFAPSLALSLATTATLHGARAADAFGAAVAGVGDVNGDGFDDILVGAPGARGGSTAPGTGAAHLFLGPLTGDHVAGVDDEVRILGLAAGGRLGSAAVGLGAIGTAPVDSFVVTAPRESSVRRDAGAVFRFDGDLSWTAGGPSVVLDADDASLTVYGPPQQLLGRAVSRGMDHTGDGLADLWVSAPIADDERGALHLLPVLAVDGAFATDQIEVSVVVGAAPDDRLGQTLSDAGDLDADGVPDLWTGSPARRSGGAATLVKGPFPAGPFSPGASWEDLTVSAHAGADRVGEHLALGDLDGDGVDDLVLSARSALGEGGVAVLLGGLDAGEPRVWFADGDGDGFGDVATAVAACIAPPDHVSVAGDCDDGDAAYRPGAAEACGDPDYDCDGYTGVNDDDADGFASCAGDCDDGDPAVSPAASELCGDAIDNDCDGEVDGPDAIDAVAYYPDADRDGFGSDLVSQVACGAPPPLGSVQVGGDCDDENASVSPAALELCDGVDNDCDGQVDGPTALDARAWFADRDGDGFGDLAARIDACTAPDRDASGTPAAHVSHPDDCDDADASVSPLAVETCNGTDDDCSGQGLVVGAQLASDAAVATWVGTERGAIGTNVAFLGDQDFDGDDEAVFSDDQGRVFVRWGRPSWGASAVDMGIDGGLGGWDVVLRAMHASDGFGDVLASGDLNEDGIDDLVVGAPTAVVNGVLDRGAVYIYFGPLGRGEYAADDADVVLVGDDVERRAGHAIQIADLDRDGASDLVVAAMSGSSGGEDARVYILWGGTALPARGALADALHTVRSLDAGAGDVELASPDLDGDGVADLLVGAPRQGALSPGQVSVWFGCAGRAERPADWIIGGIAGAGLGAALAAAGDVNGDGLDDVLVGTASANDAYLLLGSRVQRRGEDLVGPVMSVRVAGLAAQRLGRVVGGGADLDGDGLADMLVAATDDDTVARDAGALYVLHGHRTAYAQASVKVTASTLVGVDPRVAGGGAWGAVLLGDAADAELGEVLAVGGDLDGDGRPDVLLGDPTHRVSALVRTGRVLWLRGRGPSGERDAIDPGVWYVDADGDGFTGLETFLGCASERPLDPTTGAEIAVATPTAQVDCDDGDPDVYPQAPDVPGGLDADCDGLDGVGGATVDTDGDGLSDADEGAIYGTDRRVADSDGDGLTDREEVEDLGTDPWKADSDGDLGPDGVEVRGGTDPLDPEETTLRPQDLTCGDLLLTEILAEGASVCGSQDAAYVEVLFQGAWASSASRQGLLLADLSLTWDGAARGTVGEVLLAPNELAVVAADAVSFSSCYGLVADLELDGAAPPSSVGLQRLGASVAGGVVALDAQDLSSAVVTAGTSLQRSDDVGDLWCASEDPIGSSSFGSPGLLNATCAVP